MVDFINHQNTVKKIIKYFTIFSIIYLSASLIYDRSYIFANLKLAMISSILFAFIDTYYPSVRIEKNNK